MFEASAASSRLLVALNLDDRPLDVDGPAETPLAGDAARSERGWRIPPHGWAILA